MSRRVRVLLRAVQLSPLVAAALIAAAWLSVPAPLAGRMVSMAAAGVPAYDAYRAGQDRAGVADAYVRRQELARASKDWPDVQLRAAARDSWLHLPANVGSAERNRTLKPFPLRQNSGEFAPLRAWLLKNPGAHLDAYVVPRPVPAPILRSAVLAPERMPTMAQMQMADALSPYEYAWKLAGRDGDYPRFNRAVWQTDNVNEQSAELDTRSLLELQHGKFYRTLVLAARDDLRLTERQADRMHAVFHNLADTSGCRTCHEAESVIEQTSGDRQYPPIALWFAGPVDLQAVPLFSDRGGRPSLSPQAFQSVVAGRAPTMFGTVVWAGDSVDDAVFEQPTVVYVASFPSDPRAAFKAWRASWLGRFTHSLHVNLAAMLPWLLVAGAALLGVTLVGATAAFRVDRRLVAQELAREELERVQRDAHDRVYNRMSALAKRVEQLEVGAEPGGYELVAQDIRGTLGDLQSILGEGSAVSVPAEGSSLADQLAAIAVAQQARYGVRVTFAADRLPELSPQLGWDLQCVLEEALTNAAKHGRASHVRASLRVAEGRLRLRVEDDGDGFDDAAEAGSGRSSGLRGMATRLERWNGTVELRRAGGGAVLEAVVPLPR